MDPLTHIVVGRAVVAAADRHQPALRGVAWAAVLGALSPDIDAASAFSGWDRYVRVHEVGTHSILGALLMACLTATVVKRAGRLRDAVGDPEHVRLRARLPSFGALLAAAVAGAMSHLVLDVVSGARIRLGWPIAQQRITLPCVAMADPWLIAISVAGLVALWPGRRSLQAVSRAIVAATVLLLGSKGALLVRTLRASGFRDVPFTAVEAQWGALTEWQVFERAPALVRAWAVRSGGAPPAVVMSQATDPDTALVRTSRSLETVQNFLAVHEFAFPIERAADEGRTEVLWSDLRYCWPIVAREPSERAPLGEPANGAVGCGVWTGGLFGPDGRPITQLVKIGAVTQRRPATR